MDPAILSLLIGSALTLLVTLTTTWVNAKLSESKEARAEVRKEGRNLHKERITALERLYQDTLNWLNFVLVNTSYLRKASDDEELKRSRIQFANLLGQLALISTKDIANKFYEATIAVTSEVQQEDGEHTQPQSGEPEEQYPPYSVVQEQLVQLMRTHLANESALLQKM